MWFLPFRPVEFLEQSSYSSLELRLNVEPLLHHAWIESSIHEKMEISYTKRTATLIVSARGYFVASRPQGETEDRTASKVRIMRRFFACIFLLFVAPLMAQSRLQTDVAAAATGPSFEASLGYLYFSMAMPTQRVGLSGLDANALVKFHPRWAVTADSIYARTGDVLGTGHSANVLSFLAGPVFYPAVFRKSEIFIRALVGASRVESAVPASGAYYLNGWVARPSYAFGGGLEHSLFGPIGVRLQGDYQRTTFGGSANAIRGQNNVRLTTSLVYRFGNTK